MPISQLEGCLKNPLDRFLKEPMLFQLVLKMKPLRKSFPVLRQKPTQILS